MFNPQAFFSTVLLTILGLVLILALLCLQNRYWYMQLAGLVIAILTFAAAVSHVVALFVGA